MEALLDYTFLSRLQFAITAMFHIVWPILTIGLSIFLVAVETRWLQTGDTDYYYHARFWSKLLLLNFGIGVVSGIPLEFEFGTNWAPFSVAYGDFIGNILGFEGAMAFMLEAGFLGIMMFGWRRVAPGIHLFATVMVAVGASLSAFWIMVANTWMQIPTGVHLVAGKVVVDSYFKAIFNPAMATSVSHMWFASLETSLFVIGGISAWYILKNRHRDFFLKSFRLAVLAAVVVTPLQILIGDASGVVMAKYQPAKLAATEAHWQTNPPGTGAAWALLAWPDAANARNLWSIKIPDALSVITTHSLTGQVKGLRDFAPNDRPPVLIPFYAFRVMVAAGVALFALMLWTLWTWRRRGLVAAHVDAHRRLFVVWIAAMPLGYLAVEMGWLTREVGRQPWVVHGLMRTQNAASVLPASAVATTLLIYIAVYTALLITFVVFARHLIRKGPDFGAPKPHPRGDTPVRTEPGVVLGDHRSL